MTTERQFISDLAQRFPARPPVEVGIGDDGAVLDCRGASCQVIVTDMLLDGVHFDLRSTPPELAGRKAIAVNLSDLAAMGCRPTAAFVSLALPTRGTSDQDDLVRRLYDGIASLTDQFDFSLAGGDTNAWDGRLAINVCLTGIPFGQQPLLRSGARPGDAIFVTGALGGSLHSGRHLSFLPRLAESEWLVRHTQVHAMMDISDGLSIDLHRLVDASGVAAELLAWQIPVHPDARGKSAGGIVETTDFCLPDPGLRAALSDGEDFELLFTVAPEEAARLNQMATQLPARFSEIGRIVGGRGCRLRITPDETRDLPETGWQHEF